MTASFVQRPIPSMIGQPGYEVDPLNRQVYGGNYMQNSGQQIVLSSPHPFQVIPGGGQYGPQGYNGGMLMGQGYMHVSQVGDLHAPPPAYSEMDYPPFRAGRSRANTLNNFGMGPGNGYYPRSQMGQMGHMGQMGQMGHMGHMGHMGQMEYAQLCSGMMDSCAFCIGNHPMPHPHFPNMHDMPQMLPHRHMSMGMDDSHSVSSKGMRNGQYPHPTDTPMYDPFDQPWGSNRREGSGPGWGRGDSRRSRSQGPGNRAQIPYDLRISEVPSDSEPEDDMRGRPKHGPPSRRESISNLRSSSRSRPRGSQIF